MKLCSRFLPNRMYKNTLSSSSLSCTINVRRSIANMDKFCRLPLLLLLLGIFTAEAYIANQLQSAVEAYEHPVATTEEVLGQQFDGCYSDTESGVLRRANFKQTFRMNSNAMCAKICQEKGFALAATQGTTCYCENTLPLPRLYKARNRLAAGNGGPCSIRCPGVYATGNCSGDECCGGTMAFSVYIVGEIDVLKHLLYRVMDNLQARSSSLLKSLLTPEEMEQLRCNCYNGEVAIIAHGQSVSSSGRGTAKTLELTWGSASRGETLREITKPEGLEETSLKVRSIEKLLESEEPISEEPFTSSDIMCDNLFGGSDLECQKEYSETTGFSETWTTQHGFNIQTTFGRTIEASYLFVKATASFELSIGYSLTSGYSKTKSSDITEGFTFTGTAAPGTKVEVRFYKSQVPVSAKWRATVFADGYILLRFGGVVEKKVHLSRVLTQTQRQLFAFGTLNYGKRLTITGRTKTVDRNGNIVTERDQERPVPSDLQG